ncbi:hypothetical protein JCM11251_005413 [Rhodosporidiobolus azoricus]
MTSFPPFFTSKTLTIPHSTDPSLPPTTLFALVSDPHITPSSTSPSTEQGKPVLIFLHGYPQDHLLWAPLLSHLHASRPELFEQFRVVVPDLPGYGKSRKAASPDGSHRAHSKREVARDILALVDELFQVEAGEQKPRVILIGHDRGARVAYRLAKDSPDRIAGLCVQDIIPTALQFSRMNLQNQQHALTFKSYHWILLALPAPIPESFLSHPPTRAWFIHHNLTAWTGSASRCADAGGKETTTFDPEAMQQWVKNYEDDDVLLGALEDYRAGATIDLEDDANDSSSSYFFGTTTASSGPAHGKLPPTMPLLALWSAGLEKGDPSRPTEVRDTWVAIGGGQEAEREGRVRAKKVMAGKEAGGVGHFLPLEAVEEVAEEITAWVGRWWNGK